MSDLSQKYNNLRASSDTRHSNWSFSNYIGNLFRFYPTDLINIDTFDTATSITIADISHKKMGNLNSQEKKKPDRNRIS